MEKIDLLDRKILSILSKNARIPFKDVAAECNVSRAAIHQRVQHLIDADVITGSGFVTLKKNQLVSLRDPLYCRIVPSLIFPDHI